VGRDPRIFTPAEAACGGYLTSGTAHDVLDASGRFVAGPALATRHDPQTVVRYGAGKGGDVLLVRRAAERRLWVESGPSTRLARMTRLRHKWSPTSGHLETVEALSRIDKRGGFIAKRL
jgi:hypothetical protein